MKSSRLKFIAAAVAAASSAALVPQAAFAEQPATDVAAPFSVAARIDFRIIIPGFLRFRVGTADGTIDQITFDMTSAPGNVGNSTPVAGTGGDAAGTGANVLVQANNGQVTITETNNSAGLGLGSPTPGSGVISYGQISTTSTDIPNFPAPILSDAGNGTSTPLLNAGRVTNRTAVWNYAYLNATIPSAATYGGAANGGQVTYTASTP